MTRRLAAMIAASVALVGCATGGGGAKLAPASAGAGDRTGERAGVFADATAQARRLEQQGRLREALIRWRAAEAVALKPGAVAPEIERLRTIIATRTRALIGQGDAARDRKMFAAARSAYAQALDLTPDAPQAIDGLKAVETAAVLQSIATGSAGGPGMSGAGKRKAH